MKFIATVFVISRLWTALFVYLGHYSHPFLEAIPGGWAGVNNWWLNPWTTYDSYHFMSVALNGYQPQTANFFPFYPLLLRLAGSNMLVMSAWGILLSNIAFAAALFYLYRLTIIDVDTRLARYAVLALAFFPTTAYFSAVYSESVFLLLSVAAFYYVRTNRWGIAAIGAGLAGLTRNSGPLLAVMLGMEWWQATRQKRVLPQAVFLVPLAPLLAFVAVQGTIAIQWGGVFPALHAQKFFSRHLSWPWTPILSDLMQLFPQGEFHPDVLVNVSISILVFVLVWRNWRRFPWSYSVFTLGINLMNLCYSSANWPFTASAARFQMSTFPFTQMLAREMRGVWKKRTVRLLIMASYLIICGVMCWLFGRKSFIG